MMRRLLTILVVALWAIAASGAGPRWESVDMPPRIPPAIEQRTDEGAAVSVTVSDGFIYVATSRPLPIKVFSILGQLISQDTLQPGYHRLRISARGVYILKLGSATRRVTI